MICDKCEGTGRIILEHKVKGHENLSSVYEAECECIKKEKSGNLPEAVSRNAVLDEVQHDLEEFMKGLDGRIDGHSWGTEKTGIDKVSIDDLYEIEDEIEKIYKKHFA